MSQSAHRLHRKPPPPDGPTVDESQDSTAICIKCNRQVDRHAFELKRRIHDRLRKTEPFTPPRLCFECWTDAVLSIGDNDILDLDYPDELIDEEFRAQGIDPERVKQWAQETAAKVAAARGGQ
jgi:hypothetical protein